MDLRHLISVDHANIRQIADQLRRAVDTQGVAGRDNLFAQLDTEVRRHLMLMEQVVMPAIDHSAGAPTPARAPEATHSDIERMLDELASGDKGSAEWTRRFEAFTSELDRVFGEHTQLIAALATGENAQRLARGYERAKIKAIRSAGFGSRASKRRSRTAAGVGIGIGLAAAAIAAVFWQRRRQQARGGDVAPTRRRLRKPVAVRDREAGMSVSAAE